MRDFISSGYAWPIIDDRHLHILTIFLRPDHQLPAANGLHSIQGIVDDIRPHLVQFPHHGQYLWQLLVEFFFEFDIALLQFILHHRERVIDTLMDIGQLFSLALIHMGEVLDGLHQVKDAFRRLLNVLHQSFGHEVRVDPVEDRRQVFLRNMIFE